MSTEPPQRTPYRQFALTSGVQSLQSMSLSAGCQQQLGVGVGSKDVADRPRQTPAAAVVAASAGASDAPTTNKRKFDSQPVVSCQLQVKQPSQSSSTSDSSEDADDSNESDADSESTSEEEARRPPTVGLGVEGTPAIKKEACDHTDASSARLVTSSDDIPEGGSTIKLRYLADFLSAAECAHLISVSESTGFARSKVGRDAPYVSFNRTSFSSVVSSSDPVRQSVVARVHRLLALSHRSHVEVAVVRYQPNQRFLPHFDSSTSDTQRKRQYTVFVYLNDIVEGGETWFPRLNLKVRPKCGAALQWENHADRHAQHHREGLHAGLPPTKGINVNSRHCVYGCSCSDPGDEAS